ncbi:MAG: N-acetylneuraminate synthase family protein [Acidobacteria bacterium]|nr:N-acetylneuraminate synthase family protein [Acidobacteriota bacterium]
MQKLDFNKLTKPYLIGEIGINHNGDMQIAKRLMDAVFACQWDCVKFQKRNPDKAVPAHEKSKPRETPWGKMTYLEYKHRIEFGKDEYDQINQYCASKPIDWTTSIWDFDSLEFSLQYDLPFFKIPSAMITNVPLLEAAAKSGVPILISTGMSTIEEVDAAVKPLEKYAISFGVLHCNAAYPAAHKDLNLRNIPMLIKRYGCPIGYSGHEYDLEPTVLAVSLGAKIIERHITLDHSMWGTDQAASLEVHAMCFLRGRIIEIEDILGSDRKTITESEIPVRKKLRGI